MCDNDLLFMFDVKNFYLHFRNNGHYFPFLGYVHRKADVSCVNRELPPRGINRNPNTADDDLIPSVQTEFLKTRGVDERGLALGVHPVPRGAGNKVTRTEAHRPLTENGIEC